MTNDLASCKQDTRTFVIDCTSTPLSVDVSNQRCSRPLCSSQHTVGTPASPSPVQQKSEAPVPTIKAGADPSGPNSVHVPVLDGDERSRPPKEPYWRSTGLPVTNRRCSTLELTTPAKTCSGEQVVPGSGSGDEPVGPSQMLLRKEVIQPHLPVRLPCYDLVLITDPTFDGSLLYRLGHRLRVLPTFMT